MVLRETTIKQGKNWAGLAVFALAASLGIGWAVTTVAAALSPDPFTEPGLSLLSNVASGMIGLIGAFIGANIHGRKDKNGGDGEQ